MSPGRVSPDVARSSSGDVKATERSEVSVVDVGLLKLHNATGHDCSVDHAQPGPPGQPEVSRVVAHIEDSLAPDANANGETCCRAGATSDVISPEAVFAPLCCEEPCAEPGIEVPSVDAARAGASSCASVAVREAPVATSPKETRKQRSVAFASDSSDGLRVRCARQPLSPDVADPGGVPTEQGSQEHHSFVFPEVLDRSCLKPVSKDMETCLGRIKQSKIFTDEEEQAKWKERGWKAAQCCGGTLLVLALIFDELD
mmetsp:Transcript_7642/g.20830  ORF Transcript_7642/g.20830 Transcript_7642/m.20830 type:complete len:257 (-) Transcript_7642:40-810(-)|eukprot:CAMPEP_0194539226 /NCGR_PEP_ID=MMETSP0253-20130528/79119_1 /TAXON_ID=2966 /ORGANISM="Noctiluca scintillans" /LENGTH=256 /DNA_ID=CAMNT_0039385473 /DNA_START=112 /DNA_END=882 /DNA_ORIENTATION=-